MTIFGDIQNLWRNSKKYDQYLQERRILLYNVITTWTEHEEKGWFTPEELKRVHALQSTVYNLPTAYPTRKTMRMLCAVQKEYRELRHAIVQRECKDAKRAANTTSSQQRAVYADDVCCCFCDHD